MVLGKRRQKQTPFWVQTSRLQARGRRPFRTRLNEILDRAKFDVYVERICRNYYATTMGRPSIAPGTVKPLPRPSPNPPPARTTRRPPGQGKHADDAGRRRVRRDGDGGTGGQSGSVGPAEMISEVGVERVVADKGYHSRHVLQDLTWVDAPRRLLRPEMEQMNHLNHHGRKLNETVRDDAVSSSNRERPLNQEVTEKVFSRVLAKRSMCWHARG